MRRTKKSRVHSTPRNQILVSNLTTRFRINQKKVAAFGRAVLKQLRLRHTTLSVVFITDRKMSEVNWAYLRHKGTTDVIAFPFSNCPKPAGRRFLGEVIISPMRAKIYAKKINVRFSHELARYVCHGILHLMGERDHTVRERARMRRIEDLFIERHKHLIKGVI